jgi:Tfp pilus assembly protein PilX
VSRSTYSERGAVSIFIVIFTALLVTIVTTSFVQIMLRNQQQASNNDLSQSAYDSAMAGVEDAKRALVKLKLCSRDPGSDPAGCAAVNRLVSSGDDCQVLDESQAGVVEFNDGEVTVGDPSLNQAYTCVKVDVQTEAYNGKLSHNQAVVIPLIPVGDSNALEAVRISWYSAADLPDGSTLPTLPAGIPDLPQYDENAWGRTVPPIMRSQLIQFDGNAPISLDAFDGGNARTRLLYPLSGVGAADFGDDNRRAAGTNELVPGGCQASFWYKGFACSVIVTIPPFTAPQQREAYLQLAGYYIRSGGTMNYSVELCSSSTCAPGDLVDFDNVQPKVDATGRASDLFRRVRAGVTVSPAGTPDPFPEATVTTTNLCKDFFITDNPGEYIPDASGNGICEPSS